MEGVDSLEGIRIRSMRRADIGAVLEIEAETFSSPWQQETFSILLDRSAAELLVMEDDADGVIGYAVLWCILDQGELTNVAVAQGQRGRGLGRHLIGRVLDRARDRGVTTMYLEVRSSNDRALEIYRRFGFTEVGVRRDYYDEPREDARIMMATLA